MKRTNKQKRTRRDKISPRPTTERINRTMEKAEEIFRYLRFNLIAFLVDICRAQNGMISIETKSLDHGG